MIAEALLTQYGAQLKTYAPDTPIIHEGGRALFYYQIHRGAVRMHNLTEEGKEFVQGHFKAGDSFAEPPLFSDLPYPASASSTEETQLFLLSKARFFELLKAEPEVHLHFTEILSKRLQYKAMILKEISVHPPEHRIMTLLQYLKKENSPQKPYTVKLTRLQIAELTGLRVETVIRAIKSLESQEKLKLKHRKILI